MVEVHLTVGLTDEVARLAFADAMARARQLGVSFA